MMTRHASEGELVDLALGVGEGAHREHAASCAACASELARLEAGLALARKAEVPEPSPLYWEALRRNVSRAIAEEPRPAAGWGRIVSLAAAALVVALAVTGGRALRPGGHVPARVLPSWSALPAEADDPGLVVLEGVALSDGDLTQWEEGRGLAAFLSELSEEDGRTLADGLQRRTGEGDL
jgi:hypothetical protein